MLCKVTGAKHSRKMISVAAFMFSCLVVILLVLGPRRWDGDWRSNLQVRLSYERAGEEGRRKRREGGTNHSGNWYDRRGVGNVVVAIFTQNPVTLFVPVCSSALCNVSVRPHATQASKGFQELAFLTLRYRSFSKGRWRKVRKHALGFSQVKGENSLRCVMKVYLCT